MGSRKGQTVGVDFAIAMSIFVITAVVGMFYAIDLSTPSSPFGEQVRSSAIIGSERFVRSGSWSGSVYSVLQDDEFNVENYPYEITFLEADNRTTRVLSGNYPHSFQVGEYNPDVAFVGDTSDSYRIFLSDDRVLEPAYGDERFSEEQNGELVVEGDFVEATLDERGITSLSSSGSSIIQEADLDVNSEPEVFSGPVREKAVQDGVETRFFKQSPSVKFSNGDDFEFNMSSTYDQGVYGDYQGGEESFDLGEGPVSDTADYVLFYGQEDVIFLNDGMSFSISSSGGNTFFEVSHGGAESMFFFGDFNSDGVKGMFFEPGIRGLGFSSQVEGVSKQFLQEYEDYDRGDFADILGIMEMGYNITMGDKFSAGTNLPSSQNIFVMERPVNLLDGLGNSTTYELRTGVWS